MSPKSHLPVACVPDGDRKEESQENIRAEEGYRYSSGSGNEEKRRTSKRNVQVTPNFLLAPSSPMAEPLPTI